VTPSRAVTLYLKLTFVAEFRKKTLNKRRGKMGVVRILKRSSLSEAMTKNVVRFFQEKIG